MKRYNPGTSGFFTTPSTTFPDSASTFTATARFPAAAGSITAATPLRSGSNFSVSAARSVACVSHNAIPTTIRTTHSPGCPTFLLLSFVCMFKPRCWHGISNWKLLLSKPGERIGKLSGTAV